MLKCGKRVEIVGLLERTKLTTVRGWLVGSIFYFEPFNVRHFIPATDCEAKWQGRLVVLHVKELDDD